MTTNLPVADAATNAEHELLHHSVKDVCKGKEGQEAVIWAHLDATKVHKALQGGYSGDQGVVCQHDTLGVTCMSQSMAGPLQDVTCWRQVGGHQAGVDGDRLARRLAIRHHAKTELLHSAKLSAGRQTKTS